MWAHLFDDESKELDKEPFVFGADDIIDIMVADLPNADSGFKLLFSHGPFPAYQAHGEWVREEMEWNWYSLKNHSIEGWLCPALLKFFDRR